MALALTTHRPRSRPHSVGHGNRMKEAHVRPGRITLRRRFHSGTFRAGGLRGNTGQGAGPEGGCAWGAGAL